MRSMSELTRCAVQVLPWPVGIIGWPLWYLPVNNPLANGK
jgi:hypothetical protein